MIHTQNRGKPGLVPREVTRKGHSGKTDSLRAKAFLGFSTALSWGIPTLWQEAALATSKAASRPHQLPPRTRSPPGARLNGSSNC